MVRGVVTGPILAAILGGLLFGGKGAAVFFVIALVLVALAILGSFVDAGRRDE